MNAQSLTPTNARTLRRAFVDKFTNKALNHRADFYGSAMYNTCLWESFGERNVISRKAALSLLGTMPEVLVTWDRSPSNISRSLQKYRLLKMSGAELASMVINPPSLKDKHSFRPNDFYAFTPDLSCYITFTHHYIKGIGTVCLTSLPNVLDPYLSPALRELYTEMLNKKE